MRSRREAATSHPRRPPWSPALLTMLARRRRGRLVPELSVAAGRARDARERVGTDAGPVLVAVPPVQGRLRDPVRGRGHREVRGSALRARRCVRAANPTRTWPSASPCSRHARQPEKPRLHEWEVGRPENHQDRARGAWTIRSGASSSRGDRGHDRARRLRGVGQHRDALRLRGVRHVQLGEHAFEAQAATSKTARNDNSSRCRLVEVGFDALGAVRRARVQTYAAGNARRRRGSFGERAVHAFYQRCAGFSHARGRQRGGHAADDAAEYKYRDPGELAQRAF